MLTAFARAFRTPDLRKKILFTLGIIAIFRLGATIPSPGVSFTNIEQCLAQAGTENPLVNLVNLFTGGSLFQLAVFALGILPYITASIIIQLMTVVIPRLEALKNEGQSGNAKITQYTRYLTIALAVLQSSSIVALARGNNLAGLQCPSPIIPDSSFGSIATIVLVMTAGTGLVMWLGELITDRGIGNGMSILIFTSIVAKFPFQLWNVKQSNPDNGWLLLGIVLLIGLGVVMAVIFVEQGQRRIPVQYAKRVIGRRMYGGTSTYLPMKVNQAGVIPVIFASSLLYLPNLLAAITNNATIERFVSTWLAPNSPTVAVLEFLLIVFFTFFYVSITFNPDEIADNMKKYGGFIPGYRPGRQTAEYLRYVSSRLTTPGSLYLGLVAILPLIAFAFVNADRGFPFGGTTILIMVGVGLDTVKQIESQLQQYNYEGFLR